MTDEEVTLYEVEVPEAERTMIDDTPEAYRVVRRPPCVCMIYGRYHGRWQANAPARWLVAHLLQKLPASDLLPDCCEHGVREGGWCEECNLAYKKAARDAANGDN
ncbi:MAG TPA: hypothetical protein VNH18_32495 [Bryobacteraceae bacterium]|nr:hypothetical protein [Bryobacteraceae bacterium]